MTLELCLLSLPPQASLLRSREGRGGAAGGLGEPGMWAGHALTFAVIPVSVSFCRSRPHLRAPTAPPMPSRGPGEQGQLKSHEVGWARLSARYGMGSGMRLQRASGFVTRVSQTSARAVRKMDGRQGDKSQRPHSEPLSRLQRRAQLRVLRSHPPTHPRSACRKLPLASSPRRTGTQ